MSWNNDLAREQQDRLLETQTDGLASSLGDKVSRIKQITSQMQRSMEEEHVVIDNMGSSFDSISTDIGRTGRKLAQVMNVPYYRRIAMICGFIVLIFILASFR
jgi:hypothetical protein